MKASKTMGTHLEGAFSGTFIETIFREALNPKPMVVLKQQAILRTDFCEMPRTSQDNPSIQSALCWPSVADHTCVSTHT